MGAPIMDLGLSDDKVMEGIEVQQTRFHLVRSPRVVQAKSEIEGKPITRKIFKEPTCTYD